MTLFEDTDPALVANATPESLPAVLLVRLEDPTDVSPLDPVREASLRCVAGSHRWEKEVLPTRWLAEIA